MQKKYEMRISTCADGNAGLRKRGRGPGSTVLKAEPQAYRRWVRLGQRRFVLTRRKKHLPINPEQIKAKPFFYR